MLSDRWKAIAEDPRISDPRVMADIMQIHDGIVGDLLAYLGFTFEPVSPDFAAVSRNGRTCMVPLHNADLPHPAILQGPGVNKTPEQIRNEVDTFLKQSGGT